MPLLLEIVTPDSRVYSETVDHVVVPTSTGMIDILPNHIPLLSIVESGRLKIGKGGKTVDMAIDRGFVQVLGNKVSILVEAAINVEGIDLSAAENARKAAEEALAKAREKGEDPAVIEELETKARFAVIQRIIKER
jgi:F-type H+-transporting ATPase subunit epsilon